ncbi:MAG: AAA family ATPase [Weeksellaceae bacterium]
MTIEEARQALYNFSIHADKILKTQYQNPKTLSKLDTQYKPLQQQIMLWVILLILTVVLAMYVSSWILLISLFFIYKIFIKYSEHKAYVEKLKFGFLIYEGISNNKEFVHLVTKSDHFSKHMDTPFYQWCYNLPGPLEVGDMMIYLKRNKEDGDSLLAYATLKKSGEMTIYRWNGNNYEINGTLEAANDSVLEAANEFIEKVRLWINYESEKIKRDKENTFNVTQTKKIDKEFIKKKWAQIHIPQDSKNLIMKLGESFASESPEATTGILLYGPPGTGKSLIAKTLAETLESDFISVNLHDLKGKHVGESAQKVKAIWQRAKSKSRCILFIDECESVFVKRGSTASDSFTDDIVQAFIAEWDGFSKQNNVMVLGATNRRDIMDDAVLSRFAEQIEIALPNAAMREAILKDELLKNGVKPALPEKVADDLQGFSGRDIANLAKKLVRSGEPITEDLIQKLTKGKRTSGNTSVDKNATWDRLVLADDKKRELISVCNMLAKAEILKQKNINIPKGILLYGPPGTGKTQIARTMANESGLSFMGVSTADMKAGYIGQSGQLVKDIFERARSQSPCILFIDELDIVAPGRDGNRQDQFTSEIVGQLLQELDGVKADTANIFVLAATNHPSNIDSAIRSRFNKQVEIPLPNLEERAAILKVMLAKKPINFNLEEGAIQLASQIEGKSGRDIKNWIDSAEQKAIMRHVELNDIENLVIEFQDFMTV